ncbi:hypothetical protein ACFXKD_03550 [Nocardiopsis aegyptia]|uniref:hypothetical protein n=1 Tax=Nocardiopsis aegyptia TaxID=220378 RepID=UPI00366D61DE
MSFPSPPPHGPAPGKAAAYAQDPHPQPAYPQAPVPYAHVPPRPAPVIDGRDLRPGTRWYWIGGLTIPIGVLVALVVFLGLLFSATAEPELIAEFQGGDSATFQVEEGQEGHWGMYVEGDANRYACELDTPSGPGSGNDNLDTAPYSYSGMAYDSWRLTAELSTPEPGEYELRCDDLHSGTYGIGTLEQVASAETKLITGVLFLVILGPLSVIAGVVVLVVTGARRSSHRARLVQEWMRRAGTPQGPPAEPSPGHGPPVGGSPGGPQH